MRNARVIPRCHCRCGRFRQHCASGSVHTPLAVDSTAAVRLRPSTLCFSVAAVLRSVHATIVTGWRLQRYSARSIDLGNPKPQLHFTSFPSFTGRGLRRTPFLSTPVRKPSTSLCGGWMKPGMHPAPCLSSLQLLFLFGVAETDQLISIGTCICALAPWLHRANHTRS